MRVILTGSTGGLGSAIKNECISNSIEIIELSKDPYDLSKSISFSLDNIDGLIYCAGINLPENYINTSRNNIIDTMQINAISFVQLCQQIKFNDGANIIAIGSLYATETRSGRLSYTMSKHAMYGAVKTLAIEMSKNKIKVNMISPGFVRTKLTLANNSKERLRFLEENTPLGMTIPSDIAEMCKFILHNRNMTGQNIIIDGGYSLLGI